MLRAMRFLPYLVYLLAAWLTLIVVEEDAFIYFRIAQNLADGHGLVFNIGGERIESGSGLIWQLLLAGLAALPVHLVIATKVMGILFACLALWQLLKLSERFIEDKRFVIFPALLLAGSTPFYYWSHRGLETPMFVWSLLWLANWLTDAQKIRFWYLPSFVVLCARPEGFLMVAAVLPWIWLERQRIAHFSRSVGVFVGLVLAVEVWRLWYFHDLLPHAFYQKIGGNALESLYDALRYGYANGIHLLLLLAVPALFQKQHWQRMLAPVLLLMAITLAWGVYGADWKSFNRQLGSALPFVFLFGVAFASRLPWPTLKPALFAVLAAYAVYLFVYSPYTSSDGSIKYSPNHGFLKALRRDFVGFNTYNLQAVINPEGYFSFDEPTLAGDHIGFNRNATVGRFIKANYPEGIAVIFDQMGQAPWYAGLDKRFIDNTGLTDKQIGYFVFQQKARSSTVFGFYEKLLVSLRSSLWPDESYYTTREAIIERLFAENVELILWREKYVEQFPETIAGVMYRDPRFSERYRKAYRVNKRDVVYERIDLPAKAQPVVPPGALVEAFIDAVESE